MNLVPSPWHRRARRCHGVWFLRRAFGGGIANRTRSAHWSPVDVHRAMAAGRLGAAPHD